ncbi:RNA-directed DNA polymerase, eukaryota, reverse transcriptase zinc-binding domain protein, partial [Tanacetum coccineum]
VVGIHLIDAPVLHPVNRAVEVGVVGGVLASISFCGPYMGGRTLTIILQTDFVRPKFRSQLFRRLDEIDVALLEAKFTMDEVKAAVWDCSSSKSRSWLATGCNASFIVLIPKISDPLDLSDYRPISLIGCMYKVLSKLLSYRLSRVIHKLISPNQTAFLKGRQILQVMIVDACNKGIFKGLSLADGGSNISLLQYADDALFFDEWSECSPLGSYLRLFP